MRILSRKDLELLEHLLSLKQNKLHSLMKYFLERKYDKVIATEDYLIAEGDIPIALVAHMDTVFKFTPEEIFYDRQKNVMWSPSGAGFDDRIGVWLIAEIIRSGLRPHIILTTDEESGCVGSCMLVHDYPKHPFKDLKYLIQLDRRGTDDCVFYDCVNDKFEEYVESFGFTTNIGSFSDISIICPDWGVAGVNLSVGYMDEHTSSERLYVQATLNTFNKVKKMLSAKDIPAFEYVAAPYSLSPYSSWDSWYSSDYGYGTKKKKLSDYQVQCHCCGNITIDLDAMPVKKRNGGTVFYCSNCLDKTDKINWCARCAEPFELGENKEEIYCEHCRAKDSKTI